MPNIDLEVRYLFTDQQYLEYADWMAAFTEYVGTKAEKATAIINGLITQYVREFPPLIMVDREVWHSLDRHSQDRFVLRVRVSQVRVTDDQLESLADVEDMKFAIEEVLVAVPFSQVSFDCQTLI